VIAGYTTSHGAGSKDVYLVKLDADGSEVWSKTFGGSSVDVGRSVQETSDGGYIIAGYTESFDVEIHDVYLIKTDAEGNEVWSKTFGDFGPEMGRSVWETSDGGYVVAGATGSYTDNSDVYLLKVDSDGNEIWTRTFNEHIYDWGNAIRETSEGGYIVAGNTDEEEIMGIYLLRTDSEGNEIWTRTFGEPFYDYGDSVYETSDGGYIISGATKSAMTGKNDVYLVRVDSEGNGVWTTTFGDAGSEWGSAVLETKDGDYVIVGHTDSYGAGSFDVWLIRVDGEGIGVE
jgi:hypothetical protein